MLVCSMYCCVVVTGCRVCSIGYRTLFVGIYVEIYFHCVGTLFVGTPTYN